ncbi:MAG TPA: tannase/feruloyl esterase family alpha/beta hydrolase, partial [Bryobacteraceae bacterium]
MTSLRVVAFVLAALPAAAATCGELAKLALPATKIATAEAVPAGSFTPPVGAAIPNLPAFCRVAGSLQPSSDSDIQFEVWLPVSGWNGKLEGLGNGGYAGSIPYAQLALSIRAGYAAAASDTGHKAGGTDASWALGHPEKIADFGHRAVHETADKAKALVKAFYGNAQKRAYFNSCSNGGREALMEAQRYPGDYDGIIAGAPANYWTHLLTTAIFEVQALAEPGGWIPPAKLPAIQAAALAACDASDGVKDSVIDSPDRCKFDPATLLCQGAESDACLTAPQVATLKKLYAGPSIFPGRVPGAETGPGGWGTWITGMQPGNSLGYAFGTNFFKNMVYNDAAWDYHTFQLQRDMKVADDKFERVLNATDPDLKKFHDRGGKLIIYHGWNDPAISALNNIDYYKSVTAKMGAKQ